MIQNPPILKRFIVRMLGMFACLGIIEACMVHFDLGRFSSTFDDDGIIGLLTLPSLLVFQCGYLGLVVFLLMAAIRTGAVIKIRQLRWSFGVALAANCFRLWGIHQASGAGIFGIGAAGVFLLYGFLPSAGFLYFAAPIIAIYSMKKRHFGSNTGTYSSSGE